MKEETNEVSKMNWEKAHTRGNWYVERKPNSQPLTEKQSEFLKALDPNLTTEFISQLTITEASTLIGKYTSENKSRENQLKEELKNAILRDKS